MPWSFDTTLPLKYHLLHHQLGVETHNVRQPYNAYRLEGAVQPLTSCWQMVQQPGETLYTVQAVHKLAPAPCAETAVQAWEEAGHTVTKIGTSFALPSYMIGVAEQAIDHDRQLNELVALCCDRQNRKNFIHNFLDTPEGKILVMDGLEQSGFPGLHELFYFEQQDASELKDAYAAKICSTWDENKVGAFLGQRAVQMKAALKPVQNLAKEQGFQTHFASDATQMEKKRQADIALCLNSVPLFASILPGASLSR